MFPRQSSLLPFTNAWDFLKEALKETYEESVWEHLARTISAPFEAVEHQRIAVKVIDGQESQLLVVNKLK